MPTQTYPYMVMTDGTTTVTFQDGSGGVPNYGLAPDGFSPSLAGVRESPLAGAGPYEEVIEQLTITITGATASAAYANLATLAKLLEQAERWARGENETAVLFKVAPQGSTISSTSAPLQYTVLGRAPGDGTVGVAVGGRWLAGGNTFQLDDINVAFKRLGVGLLAEANASSSATTNGDLASITLAATTNPSPVRFAITNVANYQQTGSTHNWTGGYLLHTDKASAIDIIATTPSAAATGYSDVNDSAQKARSTSVLRYTPIDTTERKTYFYTTNIASTAKQGAVFINARNNSATTGFTVRLVFYVAGASFSTPPLYIPPYSSAASPKWYMAGNVPLTGQTLFRIQITATAASGSMDIDTVVVLDVSHPYSYAITVPPQSMDADFVQAMPGTLTFNHQLLSAPEPVANYGQVYLPVNTVGDHAPFNKGGTIYMLALLGGSAADKNYWRMWSGAAVYTNTFTAYRYSAYPLVQ